MPLQKNPAWIHPLSLIGKIPPAEKCWVLLYSGMQTDFTGRYSFLSLKPRREIISDGFSELEKALAEARGDDGRWFGYLGYGLKNHLEKLPEDKPGIINLPNLWMVNYETVLVFDHQEKKIEILGDGFDLKNFFSLSPSPSISSSPRRRGSIFQRALGFISPSLGYGFPTRRYAALGNNKKAKISRLNSNMAKPEYLAKVGQIKERILAGDIYQANLTRKFYGEFLEAPSPAHIFENLAKISPAPYSCIMKLDDNYIISSSPEMFLKIDAAGNVESRPIKGSAPIAENAESLARSEKDRAENLMIVDLVRNDLSRGSVPGSVEVKSLFDVTSYAALHHMSSTVRAKKRPEISSLQVIQDCFPPGSMTGAPKIKAMEICSEMEGMARGVYSGALGWIDASGEAEFSVVIRTIIMNGKKFEFQVGGAITAESDPESEWRETIIKARGITETLGIKNLI